MVKDVAILSRIPGVLNELCKLLPSINFIEIPLSSPEISKLKTDVVIGDPDLVAEHIYEFAATKWVQGTWAGLDCIRPKIQPGNIPKFTFTRLSGENFGQLMGEYVIANIVFWERSYFYIREAQQKKEWLHNEQKAHYRSINELKIGILGIGSIGNIIGRYLNNLGATVYGFGRRQSIPLESDKYIHIKKYFTSSTLSELLKNVDYVVNVLPSTPKTINILGGNVLENCKDNGTVFINVGRGNVIKESDLVKALKQKWISGAVLDVFEKEPLPQESELWDLPNVFITPHISGNSRPQDIAKKFKTNLKLYEQGLPMQNMVDFTQEY